MTHLDSDPFESMNSFVARGPQSNNPAINEVTVPADRKNQALPHSETYDNNSYPNSSLDIFAVDTRPTKSLREKYITKRTASIAALLALGIGGCGVMRASTNGSDSTANVRGQVTNTTIDAQANNISTVLENNVGDTENPNSADTPIIGTVVIDPKNLEVLTAPSTSVEETVVTTTVDSTSTTTTSTPQTTTTSPISTTSTVAITSAPETLAPAPVNPYAGLNCDADKTLFDSGWTFSEVAANCGLSIQTLRSYNQHIADINNIITGITVVYLKPASSESYSNSSSFNCEAELGTWTKVMPGETQSQFLTRIITSYGYSLEQAKWMLEFKLISLYNLDEGKWLADEERCAPSSAAIPILFKDIPEL